MNNIQDTRRRDIVLSRPNSPVYQTATDLEYCRPTPRAQELRLAATCLALVVACLPFVAMISCSENSTEIALQEAQNEHQQAMKAQELQHQEKMERPVVVKQFHLKSPCLIFCAN